MSFPGEKPGKRPRIRGVPATSAPSRARGLPRRPSGRALPWTSGGCGQEKWAPRAFFSSGITKACRTPPDQRFRTATGSLRATDGSDSVCLSALAVSYLRLCPARGSSCSRDAPEASEVLQVARRFCLLSSQPGCQSISYLLLFSLPAPGPRYLLAPVALPRVPRLVLHSSWRGRCKSTPRREVLRSRQLPPRVN